MNHELIANMFARQEERRRARRDFIRAASAVGVAEPAREIAFRPLGYESLFAITPSIT